ncbi:MAG: hypothetical protein ACFFCW_33555 [Candidatus Hodarchaeota archaeon]
MRQLGEESLTRNLNTWEYNNFGGWGIGFSAEKGNQILQVASESARIGSSGRVNRPERIRRPILVER